MLKKAPVLPDVFRQSSVEIRHRAPGVVTCLAGSFGAGSRARVPVMGRGLCCRGAPVSLGLSLDEASHVLKHSYLRSLGSAGLVCMQRAA